MGMLHGPTVVMMEGDPVDSQSDEAVVMFEIERPGFETWLHSVAILRHRVLYNRRPTAYEELATADDLRWCLWRERMTGGEVGLTFKDYVLDMRD